MYHSFLSTAQNVSVAFDSHHLQRLQVYQQGNWGGSLRLRQHMVGRNGGNDFEAASKCKGRSYQFMASVLAAIQPQSLKQFSNLDRLNYAENEIRTVLCGNCNEGEQF